MIHKILIGLVSITVIGGIVYNLENKEMYTAQTATSTAQVIVEEVEETYPDDVLEASEEAKKAVLRAFELEQDRIHIVEEMEAKNAEHALYVKEQLERIDSIDIELDQY